MNGFALLTLAHCALNTEEGTRDERREKFCKLYNGTFCSAFFCPKSNSKTSKIYSSIQTESDKAQQRRVEFSCGAMRWREDFCSFPSHTRVRPEAQFKMETAKSWDGQWRATLDVDSTVCVLAQALECCKGWSQLSSGRSSALYPLNRCNALSDCGNILISVFWRSQLVLSHDGRGWRERDRAKRSNLIKAFSAVLQGFDHVEHIQYFSLLASFAGEKNGKKARDNLVKRHFACSLVSSRRTRKVFPQHGSEKAFRHARSSALFNFSFFLKFHGRVVSLIICARRFKYFSFLIVAIRGHDSVRRT